MANGTHQNGTPSPNVVLICADQWRGDCLSVLGHPDVQTPFLDRLATGGALMTNAYSATPTCVPARMGLMTGLAPTSHRRVGYLDGVRFDVENTLPQAFKDAGYQTKAVGKMHYRPERVRIGFDDVELHDGYLHYSRGSRRDPAFYDDYLPWLREHTPGNVFSDIIDDGMDCNAMVARPWDKPEYLHPTNWVVSRVERWLYRREPDVPFFLYASFHRPHAPYDPPAWALDRYQNADLASPTHGDWDDAYLPWQNNHDATSLVAHYSDREVHQAQAGYFGNITHVDSQISRLLQMLWEFEVLDNTVIAFVSDHGDMLGDHGLWRKGFPYESSAHIPMILSGPGVAPGSQVDSLVEIRDLMPTLLDCAGVPIPDTVEGRSFKAQLQGRQPDQWRQYLHGEHTLLGQSLQWIRWDRFKYVWMSGTGVEQLFDLEADPAEVHNVLPDPAFADAVATGRSVLIQELTGRPEGFVSNGQLITGRSVSPVLDQPFPISEECR